MTDITTLELTDLLDYKAALVCTLNEANSDLTSVNCSLKASGRLPDKEFQKLSRNRFALVAQKRSTESDLMLVTNEIRKRGIAKSASNYQSNGNSAPIVTELNALRSRYQEFAADATRASSMRRMAAEFVLELNPIIRGAIKLAMRADAEEA